MLRPRLFSECEKNGAEVEVPFRKCLLMEDVLVREIEYQTKLIEKYDFDNYIFNAILIHFLIFTNNLVSRENKTRKAE